MSYLWIFEKDGGYYKTVSGRWAARARRLNYNFVVRINGYNMGVEGKVKSLPFRGTLAE